MRCSLVTNDTFPNKSFQIRKGGDEEAWLMEAFQHVANKKDMGGCKNVAIEDNTKYQVMLLLDK